MRCFRQGPVAKSARTPHSSHRLRPRYLPATPRPKPLHSVFGAVQRCIDCNTREHRRRYRPSATRWYTHLGGILAKLNYGIPMVLTVHSLEPLRPWKREQLGGGYDFSCWVEKTAIEMADAVIAVSEETKADILRLFRCAARSASTSSTTASTSTNTRRSTTTDALVKYGIDPAVPFVLFVGRITRQKGHRPPRQRHPATWTPASRWSSAPARPIRPEIAARNEGRRRRRPGRIRPSVIWIQEMVNKKTVYQLYSHAAVFCCPSIYEPFGIINLEAMACETAVVASAVGGIKEVVVRGRDRLPRAARADEAKAPSSRSTRINSPATSPRASTNSWPTPPSAKNSATPAESAPWKNSVGPPSPPKRTSLYASLCSRPNAS